MLTANVVHGQLPGCVGAACSSAVRSAAADGAAGEDRAELASRKSIRRRGGAGGIGVRPYRRCSTWSFVSSSGTHARAFNLTRPEDSTGSCDRLPPGGRCS